MINNEKANTVGRRGLSGRQRKMKLGRASTVGWQGSYIESCWEGRSQTRLNRMRVSYLGS